MKQVFSAQSKKCFAFLSEAQGSILQKSITIFDLVL